jgi:hypothetical protein
MTNIIGITGNKQNGKDTTGDYIVKTYGYKKMAFSDALKDIAKYGFGFNDEQLYGELKEVEDKYWKITPRKFLQFTGTELFRDNMDKLIPNIKKNIWIEVLRKKIIDELKENPNTKIVITDVRFKNELDFIKEMKGIIIHVKRDTYNIENIKDLHISENEIKNMKADYEIDNSGNKQTLYNTIDNMDIFNNQKNININEKKRKNYYTSYDIDYEIDN